MGKLLEFLGGLLLGALLGAAIAMLLAPEPGDKTRGAIRSHLNAVIEDGRRAAAERRAELEAQFAEAKRVVRTT